ncbi:MAG: NAD(P)-binding domain-containing protein [Acidobacteriota bacterium]
MRIERVETNVLVIGAGPIGIEVASGFKYAGADYIQIEAGALAQTIYNWPGRARFFSAPERVAVAGIPLQTPHQEMIPREEYLAYLRGVVEIRGLKVSTYERAISIEGTGASKSGFRVATESLTGGREIFCSHIVFATGDMRFHNKLDIPGEDTVYQSLGIDMVRHTLEDPHLYFGRKVLVVGGGNSALEAALRCFRSGARVSLSYRKEALDKARTNSRLYLELSILISKGYIDFYPQTVPAEFRPGVAVLKTSTEGNEETAGFREIETDFVIAATGFHADLGLLEQAGVALEGADRVPRYNPETMETNAPGIFLAGTVISGGKQTYKDFIDTSHGHTLKIVKRITGVENVPVGTVESRRYPFSNEDIESTPIQND